MFVNVILINKENEEFKRALIVVDGMALTVDQIALTTSEETSAGQYRKFFRISSPLLSTF